jgi:hypothetical protein
VSDLLLMAAVFALILALAYIVALVLFVLFWPAHPLVT